MYTKDQIREKLEDSGYCLSFEMVNSYIKTWRIDPVYEDEEGIEYFDEIAVLKLDQGIRQKEQGKSDDDILNSLSKYVVTPSSVPAVKNTGIHISEEFEGRDLNKFTVDITTQTLSLLAESIAQKISTDITNRVNESELLKPVLDNGKLKRDNEILATQVEKLLEENKKLVSRVNFLQQENAKFKHLVGNVYMKQQ